MYYVDRLGVDSRECDAYKHYFVHVVCRPSFVLIPASTSASVCPSFLSFLYLHLFKAPASIRLILSYFVSRSPSVLYQLAPFLSLPYSLVASLVLCFLDTLISLSTLKAH